ncbi:MAG: hypothetical protein LBR23_07605, partial [Spirochaetaceae bacterium]|nr:hypothetical protein [Spirochaetaceae bacterium]
MVFKRPFVILFLGAFLSCSQKDTGQPPEAQPPQEDRSVHGAELDREGALLALFSSLSETQKLSQLFLVNLEGNRAFRPVEFDSQGKAAIPGGYLLFSYNIADTAEGTAAFTASIRDYCADHGAVPPYLAIDHEGGTVNRLRNLPSGGQKAPLPSARAVSARYSPEEAMKLYAAQGALLRSLGIQVNLGPVAEMVTSKNKDFLGTRSYGGLEEVLAYGGSAIQGFQDAGVASVVKHFPGNTNADPHTGLPVINVGGAALESDYLAPFRRLLSGPGQDAAGVLMSHAVVKGVDNDRPACLSRFWATSVLKRALHFKGLVVSDDLYMGALTKNGYPSEAAVVAAVDAGVDVLMISEKKFLPALGALRKRAGEDPLFAARLEESALKVLRFKADWGVLEAPEKRP